MPFVGAAAVLEPEHATVGAALMLGTPKKVPLLQTIFHVVVCMSTRSYGGVVMVGVAMSVAFGHGRGTRWSFGHVLVVHEHGQF